MTGLHSGSSPIGDTACGGRSAGWMSGKFTFTGYHEQAILDAACQGITLQPFDSNMTQHDQMPTYNLNTILKLVQTCLSNEPYLFYAQVISDHDITPTVGTADGVRVALIQHLFSRGCHSQHGAGCKEVVHADSWPQSVAIKMINLMSHTGGKGAWKPTKTS